MRWIGMDDDGETVTLRRFDGHFKTSPAPADADSVRHAAVVDVETTGLDPEGDAVIEIGLKTFTFDRGSGQVVEIGDAYEGLEDPGRPLPPFAAQLTGLTDDELRDQAIDWDRVCTLIEGVDVVIAHNARFDRGFIDPRIGAPRKVWACSLELVDWMGHGLASGKLEMLSIFHGFFVRSHRAMADVDALLHLLTFPAPGGDTPYLAELFAGARKASYRVAAVGSPFDLNPLLKSRGYRWWRDRRVWQLECAPDALEAEVAWLNENAYADGGAPEVERVSPFDRYRGKR